MKKILSLGLISAFTLVLLSECNSTSADGLQVKTYDNAKILYAIKKVGEKNGWKITQFKNNEVVAEKTDDGDTVSSSIKFQDGNIKFSNSAAASDLSSDIKDALKNSSSEH